MNTTNKFCIECVHFYKEPEEADENGQCGRVVRLGVNPVTGKSEDKALYRQCDFERNAHYFRHTHFEERLCNPEGIYWERKT